MNWLGLDWDEGPDKGGDYGPLPERAEQHLRTLPRETFEAGGHTYEDAGAIRFRSPQERDRERRSLRHDLLRHVEPGDPP